MSNQFLSLEGKIAVVTGSARGIGRAIAEVFVQRGADVAITDRNAEMAAVTAQELAAKSGRKVTAFSVDVSDSASVKTMIDGVLAEYGHIDILVNNAGTNVHKPIAFIPRMKLEGWQVTESWEIPLNEEEWHKVLDTNLTGAFLFAQAIGPFMLTRRKGKIISISSNSAELAPPYFSAYCVSKAGLNMFTRCLATEWAPYNICVNAIGPGSVRTELNANVLNDLERKKVILSATPLGRFAEAREIGLMAVYLASSASNYVTGQTFYIDGGQLSRGNGF